MEVSILLIEMRTRKKDLLLKQNKTEGSRFPHCPRNARMPLGLLLSGHNMQVSLWWGGKAQIFCFGSWDHQFFTDPWLSFSELPQILLPSLQVPADCTELLWDSPAKRSTSTAWRVKVMPDVDRVARGRLIKKKWKFKGELLSSVLFHV